MSDTAPRHIIAIDERIVKLIGRLFYQADVEAIKFDCAPYCGDQRLAELLDRARAIECNAQFVHDLDARFSHPRLHP